MNGNTEQHYTTLEGFVSVSSRINVVNHALFATMWLEHTESTAYLSRKASDRFPCGSIHVWQKLTVDSLVYQLRFLLRSSLLAPPLLGTKPLLLRRRSVAGRLKRNRRFNPCHAFSQTHFNYTSEPKPELSPSRVIQSSATNLPISSCFKMLFVPNFNEDEHLIPRCNLFFHF